MTNLQAFRYALFMAKDSLSRANRGLQDKGAAMTHLNQARARVRREARRVHDRLYAQGHTEVTPR